MHCSNQPYKQKYSKEFIKIGLTFILVNDEPRSQCVVCFKVLANESLKAGKLKRHLTAKHSKFIDKSISFLPPIRKRIVKSKENYDKAPHNLRKSSKGIV